MLRRRSSYKSGDCTVPPPPCAPYCPQGDHEDFGGDGFHPPPSSVTGGYDNMFNSSLKRAHAGITQKIKTNNTNTKQNKTPVLTCLVTKETRTSNLEYLQNKASKAGVTVEEIVSNYVTREVLKNLRKGNLQGLSQEQANRILRLNGKQKSKTGASRREAIAA